MICALTIIINMTSFPLNKDDGKMLSDAKIRCEQLYSKSPCVKKFYKIGKRDYHVTCGASYVNNNEEVSSQVETKSSTRECIISP